MVYTFIMPNLKFMINVIDQQVQFSLKLMICGDKQSNPEPPVYECRETREEQSGELGKSSKQMIWMVCKVFCP